MNDRRWTVEWKGAKHTRPASRLATTAPKRVCAKLWTLPPHLLASNLAHRKTNYVIHSSSTRISESAVIREFMIAGRLCVNF